jgi:hypothetical protein
MKPNITLLPIKADSTILLFLPDPVIDAVAEILFEKTQVSECEGGLSGVNRGLLFRFGTFVVGLTVVSGIFGACSIDIGCTSLRLHTGSIVQVPTLFVGHF